MKGGIIPAFFYFGKKTVKTEKKICTFLFQRVPVYTEENATKKTKRKETQNMENRFYKVAQQGGTFVVGYFFNPITNETMSCCVRDYDYSDCSRDRDELYYMPIDENVRKMYLHFLGIIQEGDTVEIIRGKKIPHGTVAKVVKVYDWRDCYGRTQATYAVFEDGRKTNVNNCKLL